MNNLREYLISEWKTRRAQHNSDGASGVGENGGSTADEKQIKMFKELCGYSVHLPRQNNYYDCGIFMLQYVESFFKVSDFLRGFLKS